MFFRIIFYQIFTNKRLADFDFIKEYYFKLSYLEMPMKPKTSNYQFHFELYHLNLSAI